MFLTCLVIVMWVAKLVLGSAISSTVMAILIQYISFFPRLLESEYTKILGLTGQTLPQLLSYSSVEQSVSSPVSCTGQCCFRFHLVDQQTHKHEGLDALEGGTNVTYLDDYITGSLSVVGMVSQQWLYHSDILRAFLFLPHLLMFLNNCKDIF